MPPASLHWRNARGGSQTIDWPHKTPFRLSCPAARKDLNIRCYRMATDQVVSPPKPQRPGRSFQYQVLSFRNGAGIVVGLKIFRGFDAFACKEVAAVPRQAAPPCCSLISTSTNQIATNQTVP